MSRLLRAIFVAFAAGTTGCGEPKSAFDQADERLFALPAWCGKSGPRRPWTAWAEDRSREPTGSGVCGVRLPQSKDTEAGLCVEFDRDKVTRGVLRENDRQAEVDDFSKNEMTNAWVALARQDDLVLVRLEHGALRAKTRTGDEALEGPCFFR